MPENARLAMRQPEFLEDWHFWMETDRRTAKRLLHFMCAPSRPAGRGATQASTSGSDVSSRQNSEGIIQLALPDCRNGVSVFMIPDDVKYCP
jgi:hypothetical protein